MLAADQLAAADKKHHHTGVIEGLRPGGGHHVLVLKATRDDFLPLDYLVHSLQLVAQGGGALEVQVFRRCRHPCRQHFSQVFLPAFEEQADLADHRAVTVPVDLPAARPEAALDMVIQAGPSPQHRLFVFAGTEGENFFQEAHGLIQRTYVGVWSEVPGAVFHMAAADEHPGEVLRQGHLQVRVALVVLIHDVVAGAVLLDQVLLQDQGLHLRVGDNDIEVGHLTQHHPGFRRLLDSRLKIRADPVLEREGLADVNYFPLVIPVKVDPRPGRQELQLFFQLHLRHRFLM